jgi:hypothetical protein
MFRKMMGVLFSYLLVSLMIVLDLWRILVLHPNTTLYFSSSADQWIDNLLDAADFTQFHATNRMLLFRILCNVFINEGGRLILLNTFIKVNLLSILNSSTIYYLLKTISSAC